MKKVVSLFLSFVMLISTFACVDFVSKATEGNTLITQEDLDFINSKWLYELNSSEKAMYGNVLQNLNPDVEWTVEEWNVVEDVCGKIQKYWGLTKLLPSSISKSELLQLGGNCISYINGSIDFFKNVYYINNTDTDSIQKAYHGLKMFQDVVSIFGWSTGPFGLIVSAVISILPLADMLHSKICEESLGFYRYQLEIVCWTSNNVEDLPTPEWAAVQPLFTFDDEIYFEGLNALYIEYALFMVRNSIKEADAENEVIPEPIISPSTVTTYDTTSAEDARYVPTYILTGDNKDLQMLYNPYTAQMALEMSQSAYNVGSEIWDESLKNYGYVQVKQIKNNGVYEFGSYVTEEGTTESVESSVNGTVGIKK